jgi:PAS domain-containing protein
VNRQWLSSLSEGERSDELPRLRDTRRSRASYLEQLSARVLRTIDKALPDRPDALRQLTTLVGELLIELHRTEETCRVQRAELATLTDRRLDLLNTLPVPCLLTDADGLVVEANREAFSVLNSSERHLLGRPVVLWFKARDDATSFVRALRTGSDTIRREMLLTPREHRARRVSVVVQRAAGTEPPLWRWFFLDCEPEPA